MTDLLSPRFSRLLALALLAFSTWGVGNFAYYAIAQRVDLQIQIGDLRERFEDIRRRRVELGSLEQRLSELSISSAMRSAVIAAATERLALTRLQQLARQAIDATQGKLISIAEVRSERPSST